uniref:Response regulatory domain-containing protein n=1 Tax=Kwoniella bestiolae CBS 10118 TaxID=1296100 RepID=A0A1B9FYF7_9TREE|nr:hypothetical protein I302_06779 [Kwoniella bestiolae CBS 10118]OCF23795.1 hypothetical protein I302_06779 [Kwoniella bestiolae CBS 10118]
MSRIPSGPPYPHQLPPQPPAGYYGNPPPPLASNPLPPVMHQGLPPPPTAYPPDPNIYPFERHPQSINSGWTTAGPIPGPGPPGSAGGIPIEAYNAAAGPSRPTTGVDPYQAYAQPARSSPSQPLPPRQQPGVPWSSVQPITTPTSNSRGGVKLEDLVSTSDRRTAPVSGPGPKSSNPPQNVAVVNENGKRPNTSAGNDAAGGGGQQGPSEFIKKLYKMLEEESAVYGKGKAAGQPRGKDGKRGSVGWGRGGMSFVVWDMNDFTTKVLPQTFRHSNFSSFVRQLNKYGFSKLTVSEQVWEFQHPNFQAGGKSELENIKRKAVAPRKTAGEGDDTSPKGFGLSAEDASRINVMENRIVTLESKLDRALEEVREARARESGVMSVLKEVIGHLAANERATSGSPMSEGNYSPRILHLFKSFDSIAAPGPRSAPSTAYGAPVSALSYPSQIPNQYSMSATPSFNPLYNNAGTSQTSPRTDGTASRGSRGSISGPVPGSAGGFRHVSGAPSRMGSISGPVAAPPPTAQQQQQAIVPPPTAIPTAAPIQADQIIPKEEIVEQTSEMPTLYNGEPLGMTPIFAENPAWLTEGNQAPLPMYHRKSSDGSTLRMMYDVLSGGGVNNPTGRFTEEGNAVPLTTTSTSMGAGDSNALDTIQEQETTEVSQQAQASQIVDMVIPPPGGFETADLSDIKGTSAVSVSATSSGPVDGNVISAPSTNGINGHPSSSSSSKPFGKKSSPKSTHHHGGGSTIKPHWATTPKILVVEDDLVYRQLSSKFLSKFGCVTETVENAQGAVEKMNKDKYDLVLMDIFFGPNMDGRKATSLIRQFDNYTPIISMTSNAQPQDVDSYIRSGMNDILAKPFTKHGLFLILDKHLMHLRQAQIYEKIIPISVGVPPLSDQHVQEALAISAATIQNQGNAGLLMGLNGENEHDEEVMMRNPLAGSGWSDETYQLVLQQFLATGMMPDVNSLSNGSIGTGIIFGDSSAMSSGFVSPSGNGNGNNRKRPIEALNDDGTVIPTEWDGTDTGTAQQGMDMGNGMGMGMINGITIGFVPSGSSFMNPASDADAGRENKRARGVVG